jgi:hypothetical protein
MYVAEHNLCNRPSLPDLRLGQMLLGRGWIILVNYYLMVVILMAGIIEFGNLAARGVTLSLNVAFTVKHL